MLGGWGTFWLIHSGQKQTPAPNQGRIASGPWGVLETKKITIERPDEFITVNRNLEGTNQWFFAGYTADQLSALFKQPDLNTAQQEVLLDSKQWLVSSNGIYVTPGPETILSLSSAARERIYTILSSNPVNYYQRFPFLIPAGETEIWFEKNGLSPATDNLIRGLLYRRGNALCFADVVEALSRISSDEEKVRLEKTFSRQTTALAFLRVEEGQDVEPLVRYWGKFGQAKDIRPLLESLARAPGGGSVDIAHLLPSFARERLYTYPFPSEDPVEKAQDCFWSSLNFFSSEPEARFTHFEEVKRTIQTDYYPIQNDPTFGDVVWFVDAKGNAIHSAVYIAQQFFFTKNGSNFNEPWVLMDLDDLLTTYAIHAPLHMVAYRLRRQ